MYWINCKESWNYQNVDEDDDDEDEDFFNRIGMNHYDDYDDEDDEENPFDILEDNLKGYNSNHRKRYKNKKTNEYPQSRVLRDAKNPKRSINRHGVIICSDKDARKRDEKIIKEFLKDFFPGDSDWKKEFRHDVLKRWMKMYCIAKKDLKELERTHRKAKNANRSNINTEKTLEFTRRLFNVPIDRWNDPSR